MYIYIYIYIYIYDIIFVFLVIFLNPFAFVSLVNEYSLEHSLKSTSFERQITKSTSSVFFIAVALGPYAKQNGSTKMINSISEAISSK